MAVFNEDTRVKIPATIQFLRLGYKYQSLKEIDLDKETRIAINRFKPAIEKINGRSFSDEEIRAILDDILSSIKNNDLGRNFYRWLINPHDRAIQKAVSNRDSKYNWSEVQKNASETMAADVFQKLLPGCNVFKNNFYPRSNSLKQLCENDLIVQYRCSIHSIRRDRRIIAGLFLCKKSERR